MRILSALVGNVASQVDMQIKYGALFGALSRRVTIVEHYDARLRGMAQYWNALQTLDPSIKRWRERYFRNVPAFRLRSKKIVHHLRQISPPLDAVLQLGALFDSTWNGSSIPVVLYTDNTAAITARHPYAGRFAFKPRELAEWLAHEKELYQRSAQICVRSSLVKRSLMDDYDVVAEKITVIGGGVNFPSLPVLKERDPSREPTVLFIGQSFHRKGGDLALKAFSRVRKDIPDAKMLMVTKGPIPVDLPMEGVTHVETGWDRDLIVNLYQQSDVFILPSRQETWGDVLLEAMAFGLPCVGVAGQAMEDIIQSEVTGLLVENQTNILAEALVRLLSQRQLRQDMGQAARARVEAQFTWDIVVERLVSVLSSVVHSRRV